MPNQKPAKIEPSVVIWPLPIWMVWLVVMAGWRLLCWSADKFQCANSPPPASACGRHARHHTDPKCKRFAQILFRRLNHYRKENGLPVLRWNEQLEHSALYQSTRMAETGEFAHTLSDGVELPDRVARFGYAHALCAENIALYEASWMTITELAKAIHLGWLHSPPHLANIENREVVEVGIGVVRTPSGRYYATQNFGRPASPRLQFGLPTNAH